MGSCSDMGLCRAAAGPAAWPSLGRMPQQMHEPLQSPALSPTGTASFAASRIALVIEPGSALPVPAMS